MCSAQQRTCEKYYGGTWNGTAPCPDIEPNGCNESNWEEYYPNMAECDLAGANLIGADLEGASLKFAIGFTQMNYTGTPILEGCVGSWSSDCSFEDTDEDGYDDISYDAGVESIDVGDMNGDGKNNVIDVVMLVEDILNP